MIKPSRGRRHLLLLAIVALPLVRPLPARAFDTGPHRDMTRAALQDEGFAPASPVIQIAQVSNFLVDYYSASTLLSNGQLEQQLAHLHFDSLTSVSQIRNLWARLTLNTQAAIASAVAEARSAPNDLERRQRLIHLAVLVGASLHPVQDFYSHSNWVELYPMQDGVYGTRTWFDTPSPSVSLHTGLVGSGNELYPSGDPSRDHGGYHAGMNHDSYDRPGWSQAYVYGYSASRQWLRAIRQWVEQADSAVWQDMLALRLSEGDTVALHADLAASYQLSLWAASIPIIAPGDKDGTWKGEGSGDRIAFAAAADNWVLRRNSLFVNQFRDSTYQRLARGMDQRDVDPGPAPAMPRVSLGQRVVEVRTLRAAVAQGNPDSFINPADLYGQVTIGGQQYVEATQQDESEIQPAWLSVALVPDSVAVVPIRYELLDEDGFNVEPDTLDVNPAGGRTFAEFQVQVRDHQLSGDLSGVHDGEATAATLQGGGGDAYPASVTLYVNVRELEPQPVSPAP